MVPGYLAALIFFQALQTQLAAVIKWVVFSPMCVGDAKTCGWPAGKSLNVAMQLMAEHINTNGFLGGGHTMDLEFIDDHCSGSYGVRESAKILARSDRPFGVIGSGCSGATMNIAPIVSLNRIPHISQAATSSGLANRKSYPYLFRLCPTDGPMLNTFLVVYKSFGWTSIAQISDDAYGSTIPAGDFEARCKIFGMTNVLSGKTLIKANKAAKQQAAEAFQLVIKSKARGVIAVAYGAYISPFVCQMALLSVKGMIVSYMGWIADGWLLSFAPAECTPAQMTPMGEYMISGLAQPWHVMNTPVPCGSNGDTVEKFKAEYEKRRKAAGIEMRPEAGVVADAVCMAALAFKELLATNSLSSLYNMDEATHKKTIDIYQKTEFEGVSGKVDFPADGSKDSSGDRIGSYEVSQVQNGIRTFIGVQTGLDPVVMQAGKQYRFAEGYTQGQPPPALFVTCSVVGTVYDFPTGKCVGCPVHTSYTAFAGMCLSNRGYFTAGLGDVRPCSIGDFSDSLGVKACQKCKPGSFAATTGNSVCSACSPGKFSSISGTTACKPAPKGSVVAEEGAIQTTLCDAGNHASEPGQTKCTSCSLGRYQSKRGQELCTACPATFTTKHLGSVLRDYCICEQGTYRIRETDDEMVFGKCVPCMEGLVCPGERDKLMNKLVNPLQKRGFSASKQEWSGQPLKYVVECESSEKCPGSTPPGTCPQNYQVVKSCDYCQVGYFSRSGDCINCDDAFSALPIILTIPLGFAATCAIYHLATREPSVQAQNTKTVAITFGLTVNVLQVLGVFKELEVNWVEPIKTLHKILQIFAFDVELLNISCFFGTNAPESKYIGALLTHPIMASVLLFFFFIGRTFTTRKLNKEHLLNMQGLVMMLFYITLVIVCLLPWQCRTNPDGTSSVVVSRSTQCWETTEHTIMLVASVFGILVYIVGFTSCILWATVQYPLRVMQPGGSAFIRGWRFLFYRFSIPCYYYGAVYLLRNFLIAIVPVICVDSAQAQLVLLVFVVAISYGTQAWLRPWRTLITNYFDGLCSICLLMILIGGATLLKVKENEGTEILQVIFGFTMVCMIGAAVGTLGLNLYLMKYPRKPFDIFLSHYKLAHAVLARWFKLKLSPVCSGQIFLDSDCLESLDKIIEVVAHETRICVVILGKETLSRIWCAGEVTAAEENNVTIACVACTDYESPSDQFVDELHTLWTSVQMSELMALGVAVESIKKAYGSFRKRPTIALDRTVSYIEHDKVIDEICRTCDLTSRIASMSASKPASTASDAQILIYADDKNDEAGTTAVVLMIMLQKEQLAVVVSDRRVSNMIDPAIRCFITLLTPGVILNAGFAQALVDAFAAHVEVVSVAASPSFVFPANSFFEDLEAGKVAEFKLLGNTQELVIAFKKLFNVLALRFSPQGSDVIQRAEVSGLGTRMKALLDRKPTNIQPPSKAVAAAGAAEELPFFEI